ncbi:hypothetical protein B0H63DRAFT_54638 [Podospora didyma]|uniref:Mid2 domain-containing protein n=1 Tax=Podospora didyma TaxID=330526 RepID=A0AAE0P7B2_9PEZI|nr:hypothetical protein B0H63DRAFT_54638 [Podospora didyma]
MRRLRLPLQVAALAAICASASTIPASQLFERQSTCAEPGFSQCKATNFPSFFCCPPNNTCTPLAGNTTLLCCPAGADCSIILPISCDLSQQDGEKHADAAVKTTALRGTMQSCDTGCCPFGYSCTSDKKCKMDSNQNAIPLQQQPTASSTSSASKAPTSSASGSSATVSTSVSSSPTTSGTSTGPTNAQQTSGPAATTSAEPAPVAKGPPIAVIAGASAGGALAIIIGVFIACILLRRKKEPAEGPDALKLSRSTSSFGNFVTIGPPIVTEDTVRTDFGRYPPRTEDGESVNGNLMPNSTETSPAPRAPSAAYNKNPARQSSIAYGYAPPGIGLPYADDGEDDLMPSTPRPYREPSSVSINVFADPRQITPEGSPENNRRYSHLTTFTQMMEEADLGGVARGRGYVPYRPDSSMTQATQSASPQARRAQ